MSFRDKKTTKSATSNLINFLGSNVLFFIIVALFVLQATWLVFSFQYAMLYDESYHYGAIKFFSETLNPSPSTQPTSFDTYGLFVHSNASLYHYIMSMPFRIISFFTSDFSNQIIALRIINVLLAVSTLFIYRKLFLRLNVKKAIVNTGLLVYTLIPIVSLLSATISYDNLVMPLTGLFLLFGIEILSSDPKKLLLKLYLFVLVGALASLAKFTFLPVFIAGLIFVLWKSLVPSFKEYKKLGKRFIKQHNAWIVIGLLSLPLLFFISVGISRYGVSTIKYGSVIPDCKMVIGEDRCNKLNYYRETEEVIKTKNERSAMSIDNYLFEWANKMMTRFDTTGIQLPDGPGKFDDQFAKKIPLLSLLITVGQLVIFFCSMYMLHKYIRDKRWQLILVAGVALTAALFMFNIKTYYLAHENINIQVRYLLGFVPIIIVFGLMSIDAMIKSRAVKLTSLVILLLLSTQGGGVLKHIVTAKSDWYWQNSTVARFNKSLKKTLEPYIYQGRFK